MEKELGVPMTLTCRNCGQEKQITAFDIRADTGRPRAWCKDCRRAYQNERNARLHPRELRPIRLVGTTDLLLCTRCREMKPAQAFPRHRRGQADLQSWCRDCFAALNALYYSQNREREIARIQRNKAHAQKVARDLVDAYLATHPCVDCGESDHVVLEFDHIGEKRMEISLMVAAGASRCVIEAEIAKCEVRCGNDHRRKTEERRLARSAEAHGMWSRVAA